MKLEEKKPKGEICLRIIENHSHPNDNWLQITNIIDMDMRPRPQWKCERKKTPNRDTLLDLFGLGVCLHPELNQGDCYR